MAVIDPTAIKFSNEQARVGADLMARAYFRSIATVDRWNALGAGQAALDQMGSANGDIRKCADAVAYAYSHCYGAEVYWFLGVNLLFPNDATAVFDNGTFTAQDIGRPLATGAKVQAVMSRAIQFQNWLLSVTQSFTDSARGSRSALNTVFQATTKGTATLSLSDAGNLMNRATELKTNFEATTNANLNNLLAFSVNPNPGV